ncbi:MAG: E3 binding domain-containing protein, partial [Actinobacteria bacterium]|nr:E3 binding domain-containing protein [Actinomycetota bacterium]
MATEIVMPRLSDSMEEGTILAWLRRPGEEVAIGQELVEIETDKANMVYEADATGTLLEILVDAGGVVPVGAPIARLGSATEVPEGPAVREQASSREGGESNGLRDRVGPRLKASPIARRLAADNGVDLAGIAGSGPGGRIVKADVEAAVDTAADSPAGEAPAEGSASPRPERAGEIETAKGRVEVVEADRQHRLVARRMSES